MISDPIGGEDGEGSFDLEMKDVPDIEWTIDRNEFGLDFRKIFPENLWRVVVTDPNFPVRK